MKKPPIKANGRVTTNSMILSADKIEAPYGKKKAAIANREYCSEAELNVITNTIIAKNNPIKNLLTNMCRLCDLLVDNRVS